MLDIQKKYIDYLRQLNAEIGHTSLSKEIIKNFRLEDTIKAIEDIELLVPVIGAFSAGKSTLLNSFIGKKYLPEKVTPETALATELRYSQEEYIEAVKNDGTFEKFSIEDIEKVKDNASEFKYIRVYLNNQNVKSIQPLILVDMPGFESPLDLHNQAIMEYLDRGVHYIVLSSVEDGNITKSMIRELQNIQEYDRDFSFFLSKTNLKPQDDIEAITQKVKEQLEDFLDKTDEIGYVDLNGGESLKNVLLNINPEQLFEKLYKESLIDLFYAIKETLNTNISALGKSKKENEESIQNLKKTISNIHNKRNALIEDIQDKYTDTNINNIVEYVGRELSNSINELVQVGVSRGEEGLSSLISEITRSALIFKVKGSISDITNEIIDDFSYALTGIDDTMNKLTLSENWLGGITTTTKKLLSSATNTLEELVKKRKNNPEDQDKLYKIITTILAVTTNVVNPLVELIIVFLPDLLDGFLQSYKEKKQKEQLKNILLTQTIPTIKRELRTKLPEVFNKQIEEMIESIASRFEEKILEKQVLLETTQKEIDKKNIDIDQTISQYQNVNHTVTSLTDKTLF